MPNMLMTLPEYPAPHDVPTRYIGTWSKEILAVAQKNGIVPMVLEGKAVRKDMVADILAKKEIQFVSFNGHGNDNIITGHNFEPLITFGENHDLLKGKIVHALTCSSGNILGKGCEAKAFIGYNNAFILVSDYLSETRPRNDRLATPIIECALEAPLQIVKRKTAKESYEKSQEAYQKMIDEYTISSSKHTAEELDTILPVLVWNRDCQVRFGEADAKIE